MNVLKEAHLHGLQASHGGVLLLLATKQALDGIRCVRQPLPQPYDLACMDPDLLWRQVQGSEYLVREMGLKEHREWRPGNLEG